MSRKKQDLGEAGGFFQRLCSRLDIPPDLFNGIFVEMRGRTSVVVHGCREILLYTPEELDTELLMGVPRNLINIYSRERFFELYLGVDIPFANEAEIEEIERDARFAEMAEYPYYGSVARIDDHIVVKLG